MATARLLKDLNYYFLVILAAPLSHSRKRDNFRRHRNNATNFVCAERSLLEEEFYCFWVQTSTVKTYIYTADKPQPTAEIEKKSFHHYNSISYCLFEHSLRFSLTLSHRENFSFKAPLKYKRNKKRTTFKRSSSHKTKKYIYKKYTWNTRVEKVRRK